LAGCAPTGSGKVTPVNLPPPSPCLAPVPVPTIKAGDDARIALARHRAALGAANGNLICASKWYKKIRADYARK